MKKCCTCQNLKPLSDFNRNRAKTDGLQNFCRECSHKRFQAYYQVNRDKQRKTVTERNRRVARENQVRLVEYLQQHPCVDCGEDDVVVLDLDHVREDKHGAVSMMAGQGYSWSRIEKEIAKCDVRCANCHRRRTARQLGHFRAQFLGA